MTNRTLRRTLRGTALTLALAAGVGAAPSAAQVELPRDPAPQAGLSARGGLPEPGDGFDWERVGDRPIDIFDIAFGPDGTLWATGREGPHWLDLTGGFPGAWVLPTPFASAIGILPLGGDGPAGPSPDTLLATTTLRVERSTDGGQTWEEVYYYAVLGPVATLYEIPEGLPHAGRILVGGSQNAAYSDDRGATWTPSVVATLGDQPSGGRDFVALPAGAAHPGRIVAATLYGAALSDDGGATFRPSALWSGSHSGEKVGYAERPGGDARGAGVSALVGGWVNQEPDSRVWVSEDEGETWGPGTGGIRLLESPPSGVSVPAVLSLGGPRALVVLQGGTVYRTDDAGQTWEAIGRAPDIDHRTDVHAAAVGPDGRLYVGLHAGGSERAWVWRTNEVVTASEPGPEAEGPEGLGLEVRPNPFRGEAQVTLSLSRPAEVEAALYDVLGREVAVLASGRYPVGHHEVALDAGQLPPGVYVVRVTAGGAFATTTVTLLR